MILHKLVLDVINGLFTGAHAFVPSPLPNSRLIMRCRRLDVHHSIFGGSPRLITIAINYFRISKIYLEKMISDQTYGLVA